jgi:hypothetical protein
MKQLLVDYQPFKLTPQQLNEAQRNPNAPMRVQGLLSTANKKNQNERVYPKPILEREVNKYMELVRDHRALGELDHPDSSIIELKNVSHKLVEAHWEGDNLYGTFEILTTPSGNILRELIKNNVTLGVSSRAMGSVQENGDHLMVEDDLELICWDFVSNPSNYGSFMSPLNESVSREASRPEFRNIEVLVRDIITTLN